MGCLLLCVFIWTDSLIFLVPKAFFFLFIAPVHICLFISYHFALNHSYLFYSRFPYFYIFDHFLHAPLQRMNQHGRTLTSRWVRLKERLPPTSLGINQYVSDLSYGCFGDEILSRDSFRFPGSFCKCLEQSLTRLSLASLLWDIGKQNSPRCDAAERGVPSGAILFA